MPKLCAQVGPKARPICWSGFALRIAIALVVAGCAYESGSTLRVQAVGSAFASLDDIPTMTPYVACVGNVCVSNGPPR
jgi:hypothetical protein